MRKMAVVILAVNLILVLAGCGNRTDSSGNNQTQETSRYETALDVLEAVLEAYDEENLFAMYGGDTEHAVMDAPGQFDISKVEEMDQNLGLPESQGGMIEDAASMVHLMNGNTFTGAAWHLKQGTDIEAFAEAVTSNIQGKQWLCGQPETLLIVQVDGEFIVTAFGAADLIDAFQDYVISVTNGEVLTEEPIG